MRLSSDKSTLGSLTTNRLEAFSDGVLAIVITLLILEIEVPEDIPKDVVRSELPQRLLQMWPHFRSYVISFILIGIYWIIHHAMFHYIKRCDHILLWINLLFLMSVAFIPFPTDLMAEYGHLEIAVIIYGSVHIVTGLLLGILWWYATHDHRLVSSNIDPRVVSSMTRRVLVGPFIYIVSIGLSFFSISLSMVLYLIVPSFYLLSSLIDHHWIQLHDEPPNHGGVPTSQPVIIQGDDEAISSGS